MNWFQTFFSNPNVHAIASALTGAASILFPAYSLPLQVVSATLAGTAAAIPEHPVAVPMPVAPVPIATPVVNLPPAQAGGSYHAIDYANLAAALVAQLATPKPVDGRS